MGKINSQVMKHSNVLLILRTIQRLGPISRTALTKSVGLTTASVINITNDLVAAGLLQEAGLACQSAAGRRSVMLQVRAKALYALGMELSTEAVTVGICDFSGEFVTWQRVSISADQGVEPIVQIMVDTVKRVVERAGVEKSEILGLGLAAPGPLDRDGGIMINPPNLGGWSHVPITDMLEERLGLRVCCDKESNAAALAALGDGPGNETVFFLSMFRLGIGGGLVSGGNVFHGFCDGAGEIGHTTVDPAGSQCSCGSYGCLEAMVSGEALVRRAKRLYKMGLNFSKVDPGDVEALSLEVLFARSAAGDGICLQVVQQAAVYLATALGNVISLLSPQSIVLGGTMASLSPQLVELIQDLLGAKKYPSHCGNIQVTASPYGDLAFTKGAVILAMDKFLPSVAENISQPIPKIL